MYTGAQDFLGGAEIFLLRGVMLHLDLGEMWSRTPGLTFWCSSHSGIYGGFVGSGWDWTLWALDRIRK